MHVHPTCEGPAIRPRSADGAFDASADEKRYETRVGSVTAEQRSGDHELVCTGCGRAERTGVRVRHSREQHRRIAGTVPHEPKVEAGRGADVLRDPEWRLPQPFDENDVVRRGIDDDDPPVGRERADHRSRLPSVGRHGHP